MADDGRGETYAGAGVDIEAGELAVAAIKDSVRSTYRPEVVGELGGFGGFFDMTGLGGTRPLLVSSTDGVGTKAMVATAAGRFDTIGIDLVAMCVDDLVCSGAEPLFFLDYVSVGSLDPRQMKQLVDGVAEGCRQAGCALVGGEMAEHPGAMEPGDFDLVGFAVGVVDAESVIEPESVGDGDALVGLHSPGLRSNGYSFARRLLFDVGGRELTDEAWPGAGTTVVEELLLPSVIYSPAVRRVIDEVDVHGIAHITGGGIPGNLNRVLPTTSDAVVDHATWEHPPIFAELQRLGAVSDEEMAKAFNLGIGMILVVPASDTGATLDVLDSIGQAASVIGKITPGAGQVHLT